MKVGRRIVVTGMGVVSPVGTGIDRFWQSITNGTSGVRRITHFDPSAFRTQFAGECPDFDPLGFMDPKEADRMDRYAQMAVAAAKMAVEDSRITAVEENTGLIIGTGTGGISSDDETHKTIYTKGIRFVKPLSIPMIMYNAAASHVSMKLGLKGPGYTISTACASGAQAIGEAFRLIRHGYVDTMVAGGADAPITYSLFSAWNALRVLSARNDEPERACRPFSKDRDGIVLAEGSGILVLEELQHALKRSAKIYGEIAGYAANYDAHHLTFPKMEGEVSAVKLALNDAGIMSEDVDYINAHGTATAANDQVETKVIKEVFGERAYSVPVSSIKSMTGHSLGAAGAIEFISSCLSLTHNIIPPTINYTTPDPECDLDYVTDKARGIELNTVMSNSFGFGGNNAVIIIKKFK